MRRILCYSLMIEAKGAKLQELDRLWNPNDATGSKAAFTALIPEAESLASKDRSSLIELHSLIARCEGTGGDFRAARASLEKSKQLLDESQAVYRVSARLRWLVEKARVLVLERTPSQAHAALTEAWALAINSGEDDLAVEVAQQFAAIESQKMQLEWIRKGIELAESSPSPRAKRWLGSLYASWGWKLYDVRQFESALEKFHTALRHFKAAGTARELFVAKWSVGKVLRALGKLEEALGSQQVLLAELGIGGARDGRLYEEIAECLQALKRAPEAQLYFELAYRELIGDEWAKENQPQMLKRMKDLGKVK
jgi:tetratricopeptide (TPR) repeat protein